VGINVENIVKKINIRGILRLDEPMSLHTSFRIGGPADIYARPSDRDDLAELLALADREGLPVFILGGGANILVSDLGIRGLVIDMADFSGIEVKDTWVIGGCGTPVSSIAEAASVASLAGMEFIYRMPGSLGGALWMNARCYGRSIGDIPGWIEYFDPQLNECRLELPADSFGYKISPFQKNGAILLRAGFQLVHDDPGSILMRMKEVEEDRRAKGHFEYPSAGSVFKNNRSYGQPTGAILDRLGLKGTKHGSAQIAPFHANIIINTGGATAEDVAFLVSYARETAYKQDGIELEPEIRFVGEWREGRES
jgi:UDP-N-acetylmuramate dehydrogenase